MTNLLLANASALGAPQVVFVSLVAVVTLLSLRAVTKVMGVVLSRSVSRTLDGAVVVLFVLFIVLVIVRFKVIG
ncbi:MAG TPA: hypothetical protein VGZ68_00440 [Acidimicrobiales bacterium]|nr:hypothetical protein [Acidimicrobiales bacterium]